MGGLIGGGIGGSVIGILCIVIQSLPLCCGVGLKGGTRNWKIFAVVAIVLCAFSLAIPAITAKVTTDSAIEKWCNECGGTTSVSGTGQAQTHATCKEQDKQNAKNTLGALGI